MYLPAVHDEKTTLRNYLTEQIQAIRNAAHGLTDDQARSQPLASTLSVAGLMKHCAWCLAGALHGAGRLDDPPLDLADFYGSFTWAEDRSLDELRGIFDGLTAQYLAMFNDLDMDQVMPVGPAPWFNLNEPADAAMRYMVVHHVEEFARHAGHADIIREQIDGAQAASLMMAIEGIPGNEYVQPWQPA